MATASVGINRSEQKITVQDLHDRLGHIGEEQTKKIAKELGLTISKKRPFHVCTACTLGKIKRKKIVQFNIEHERAKNNNERVYLDVGWLRPKNKENRLYKPYWRIIVDERTQMKHSAFFNTKKGMVEPTCELFQHWRATGQSVQHVRLDNAGENKRLQQRSESADWKLGIHYEFTDARTPQRNCLAEVAFQTILCRGRAMMAHANMPMDIRYRVFRECMITATLLDGLTVIELGGITATRYVHWCGANPRWSKHLRVFGEAGTVKTATKTTPKIANGGEHQSKKKTARINKVWLSGTSSSQING